MKKQFDWRRFKREKIAVHCKTEEEAKDFCRNMHDYGMKWSQGQSYLEKTYYDMYREHVCCTGYGTHCYYSFYEKNNYTILEWSDYMQKEFTKADLKDWMIVEERRGKRSVIFGKKMLTNDNYNTLNDLSNDMIDVAFSNPMYDIVKVFTVKCENICCLEDIFNDKNLELIWERDETKRMTTEEMRRKLEELTGEKVEVEPSRNEMVGTCHKYCNNMQFCKGCVIAEMCHDNGAQFVNYCDDELKECYEKVIADGNA